MTLNGLFCATRLFWNCANTVAPVANACSYSHVLAIVLVCAVGMPSTWMLESGCV